MTICVNYNSSIDREKYQLMIENEQQRNNNVDNEDESQENSRFVSHLRLVVGGLALPTIAVILERIIIYGMFDSTSPPSIVRTSLVKIDFNFFKVFNKYSYYNY